MIDADALKHELKVKRGCIDTSTAVGRGEYIALNKAITILDEQITVEDVPRNELNKLAKKVSDMREAQKRFFKGRSLNDLTVSKQLEAEVDATVKAILDPDLTLF